MYTQHIILDFEMNPVSCSTKKSGEYQIVQEIIEIGAVRLDRDFNEKDHFQCMVKPFYSAEIADRIKKLTGITTREIENAPLLETALTEFAHWIGNGESTRIYSWSNSDLEQLKAECAQKGIPFPENMKRWTDLQMIYPRMIGLENFHRHYSLKDALGWSGMEIDMKRAHRALYDAEKTTELLLPMLDGSYLTQRHLIRQVYEESSAPTSTLGDLFGDVFAQTGGTSFSDENTEPVTMRAS